jgi:hypothetical protein
VATIESILENIRRNPKGVRFRDLCKVCDNYFGQARISASSHRVYKTPWQGDPRINIQDKNGMARTYQVRQVLQAISIIEGGYGEKNR